MVQKKYIQREVIGKPSTERVKKRYKSLLDSDLFIDSQRMRLYTEYMKENWLQPPYSRQGGALKYVLSHITPAIKEDELVVGSMTRFIRGTQLYPEYENRWIREALEGVVREEERYMKGALAIKKDEKRVGIYILEPEDREDIEKALDFWKSDWRSISESVLKERDDFDLVEKWQQQLIFFRFMWDVPEGRVVPAYVKVIDEGLESIINICHEKIKELQPLETEEKLKKYDFYNGTILALEGIIAFAENYAREAERLAKQAKGNRREELLQIAEICKKVPRYRSNTFREAVQSFWFTHCALFIELNGRGISPGRFDQYMYRPFKDDIESGRITNEDALELLELLRVKHSEIIRAHAIFTESYQAGSGSNFQNVTLGGVDKDGCGADNELSKLVLQAGINVRSQQPTLSVRWSDNISHDFKLKAIECIKAGSGYPALVNENIGVERLLKHSGATLEDARDWVPCGCLDVNSSKRPPQWSVPYLNAAKLLEIVLNDGVNPITGDRLIETGIKVDNATFNEIKEAWKRLLEKVIKKETEYWNIAICIKNRIGLVVPILSALLDDCIENGLHCQEGGCRYNDSAYINICGVINVANSLAAIKKCIFDEKLFNMKELREALSNNFKGNGYDNIRYNLLKAPKFGNNDKYVDQIAVELYDAYAEVTEKNLNWLGKPWRPSGISVTAQIVHGNACAASPDGRLAGEHLCDGSVSAYPGSDICGPTSLIKSATSLDHAKMQSHLFNMKFHPTAIEGPIGSEKFVALNDTYFDLGGYHVQFNIVDANMLRDAQKHPEKYSDLMVRIAGFTARWIELGPAVQEEVIRRTDYHTI